MMQRPDQAAAIFEQLAKGKEANTLARLKLASLRFAQSDREKAYAELDGVLGAQPQNADALLLKTRFLMAEEKVDDALKESEAAVKADPKSAEAKYLQGLALAVQEQE